MNFITRKLKKIQQLFTPLFHQSAFFMQGQMDINPESRWFNQPFVGETGGLYPKFSNGKRRIFSLEPWDNTRKDMIVLLLRTILENGIEGEFVELGVYKGFTARLIHGYAPDRPLHLFDTFDGFPEESMKADKEIVNNAISKKLFQDTSEESVKSLISSENGNVFLYPGFFPKTIPDGFDERKFAFVHLDADLYQPVFDGLSYFYDRMSVGGFILVHDYNAWIGARKAVDRFFKKRKEIPIPMPDKSGSVLIQKQ